ncbi:50S ribosomal protein L16 3-hydroxylase [Tepidimonas thermarum]|uniref:50S ribosomal protein L16 3-hydroxylase n=1 Tax=Tepidimonas thermarum TaxID=335431 RepID=A0A554WZW4_9BURK|nr:cupin domain-containing protein [Tepidimonas thermarum]TSE29132.1 50S ribosomal protein L16 3-hydroxylase [Tepidimonas thermarum]
MIRPHRHAHDVSHTPTPDTPIALLGGLSPAQFMRRHWQRRPLLIRQAIPGFAPLLSRTELLALAARDDVESRVIEQHPEAADPAQTWRLRHGPFDPAARRGEQALPPRSRPGWTLLVQGVDLHHDGVHALMQRFRFVPDVRLDDVMISWASDRGGVGPHYDSYDVFLLQASGRRRWRIGRQRDLTLRPDLPCKILQRFEPEQEWVLEPGDMLYLPPRWAHDGVAEGGDCMTYSIGFRVPERGGLAAELAQRLADDHEDDVLYRDPQQPATAEPARIPAALHDFARAGLQRLLADEQALACALGEVLTEPKPRVWFDPPAGAWTPGAVVLDRRTRMAYDDHHVFINGEALLARGRDARLMRRLADARALDAASVRRASADAQRVLAQWFEAGWLHLADA